MLPFFSIASCCLKLSLSVQTTNNLHTDTFEPRLCCASVEILSEPSQPKQRRSIITTLSTGSPSAQESARWNHWNSLTTADQSGNNNRSWEQQSCGNSNRKSNSHKYFTVRRHKFHFQSADPINAITRRSDNCQQPLVAMQWLSSLLFGLIQIQDFIEYNA